MITIRTKNFGCVNHDEWGSRKEIIAHYKLHEKKCTIVQEITFKKSAPRKKFEGMSEKQLAARKRTLLGDES